MSQSKRNFNGQGGPWLPLSEQINSEWKQECRSLKLFLFVALVSLRVHHTCNFEVFHLLWQAFLTMGHHVTHLVEAGWNQRKFSTLPFLLRTCDEEGESPSSGIILLIFFILSVILSIYSPFSSVLMSSSVSFTCPPQTCAIYSSCVFHQIEWLNDPMEDYRGRRCLLA